VLDIETLRFMLGVMSLVILALFYLGVYRPTHSPFSGWWSLALLCAAAAAALLLANESSLQVILNPASNAVAVVGATCVWFATRSLRLRRSPVWVLALGPVIVVPVALADNPATNIWAGNGVLFALMTAGFGAGAYEAWQAWAARSRVRDRVEGSEAVMALMVSALAGTALAALYGVRTVIFFAYGPSHPLFSTEPGIATATILLLVCLVAFTFSVSAIGWYQRTQDLRRRAEEDDLTGLLARGSFLERAQETLSNVGGRRARRAWIVVGDVDNLKPINDEQGHLAGDKALLDFADIAKRSLRAADAVGRLGGDEFGFVLENIERQAVLDRLDDIRLQLALAYEGSAMIVPTVSFGVAECLQGLDLTEVLGRADAALYDAKDAGRDRAIVFEEDVLEA
jgi:diguanylate cyclase (GGDEF)-like protein